MGTASTRSKAADEGDKGILLRAYAVPAAGNSQGSAGSSSLSPVLHTPPPSPVEHLPPPCTACMPSAGAEKIRVSTMFICANQGKKKKEKKKAYTQLGNFANVILSSTTLPCIFLNQYWTWGQLISNIVLTAAKWFLASPSNHCFIPSITYRKIRSRQESMNNSAFSPGFNLDCF